MFKNIPIPLLNTFISAGAIIIGSLLGAYCTYVITMKNTRITLKEQKRILYENIKQDEKFHHKRLCQYANIVRLDICTAIYQSIRILKMYEKNYTLYRSLIPLNRNYASVIAALSHKYELEELSYIYQLYGLMETINEYTLARVWDIKEYEKNLIEAYKHFLQKLYGENFIEIVHCDIDNITYKELYDNDNADDKYRNILIKLDEICDIQVHKSKDETMVSGEERNKSKY